MKKIVHYNTLSIDEIISLYNARNGGGMVKGEYELQVMLDGEIKDFKDDIKFIEFINETNTFDHECIEHYYYTELTEKIQNLKDSLYYGYNNHASTTALENAEDELNELKEITEHVIFVIKIVW